MKFSERVEQRAHYLIKNSHSASSGYTLDSVNKNMRDFYMKRAFEEVVGEWATANQGAMEALVEGRAAVVETEAIDLSDAHMAPMIISERIGSKDPHPPVIAVTRLDTPQEKK